VKFAAILGQVGAQDQHPGDNVPVDHAFVKREEVALRCVAGRVVIEKMVDAVGQRYGIERAGLAAHLNGIQAAPSG